MRLTILALALLAFSITAATAGVPNMTCKAEGKAVGGPVLRQYDATDVFRVANGKLYHRWSSRKEYFYNDIREVEPGRYLSGHMVFVLEPNNRSGYVVVIAAHPSWTIHNLDCN